MPGPLLGREHLWFDSCKLPPPARKRSLSLCILGGCLWEVQLYDVIRSKYVSFMFIDDMHSKPEKEMTEEELAKKENYRKHFHSYRDVNKDGYIDRVMK